jgi:signal peptidase II
MISDKIKHSGLKWWWLAAIALLLDQITKYVTVSQLSLYQVIEVTNFLNFTYVQNPGAAFSFLADQNGWQRWFFTGISTIASIIFFVWLIKLPANKTILAWALSLMLAGALGNLIDRALYGYVIDFIDFYWEGYHWPAFNIADSSIFIGAVLMIIDSFQQSSTPDTATEKL